MRAPVLPGEPVMRALTIWEPWASAIAVGLKRIETRSWPPPERILGERIAVHAAVRPARDGECPAGAVTVDGLGTPLFWLDEPFTEEDQDAAGLEVDGTLHAFPLAPGAVVATAVVRSAFPTEAYVTDGDEYRWDWDRGMVVPARESLWGDFTPGRWGWLLTEVEPVHPPAPARGRQGLWTWNPEGD